jgi:hypothetical protein
LTNKNASFLRKTIVEKEGKHANVAFFFYAYFLPYFDLFWRFAGNCKNPPSLVFTGFIGAFTVKLCRTTVRRLSDDGIV